LGWKCLLGSDFTISPPPADHAVLLIIRLIAITGSEILLNIRAFKMLSLFFRYPLVKRGILLMKNFIRKKMHFRLVAWQKISNIIPAAPGGLH